jgi:hypothetical protein
MKDTDITNGDTLTYEVEINLNMLRLLMLKWIRQKVDSTNIITIHQSVAGQWVVELLKKLTKPTCLSKPLATARYSASALDREIVFCRFEDQETRLSPRNTA